MTPTSVSAPDLTAITVFLASTATLERGGLPYLDAVLSAEDRLAATRVVRDLGALPPDAILYLLAQPSSPHAHPPQSAAMARGSQRRAVLHAAGKRGRIRSERSRELDDSG